MSSPSPFYDERGRFRSGDFDSEYYQNMEFDEMFKAEMDRPFKQAAEPKIEVETKELESWHQELDEMVVRLDIEDGHVEQAIHDLRDRIYAYLH